MAELTLVLQKPVEELIPLLIEWNNEELMEEVSLALEKYDGIAYDDTQIGEAKADRAKLNKFCETLNAERVKIGKVYTAPYEKFKGEVDEVIGRVKTVIFGIDEQVRVYETEKKEKKKKDIMDYFRGAIGDFANLVPYDKIHNPKWLNTSSSMQSIKKEIDGIVGGIKNAVAAIEELNSEDEDELKIYYFRTLDLSSALFKNEQLKKERARVEELGRLQGKKATEKSQLEVEEKQPVLTREMPQEKTMTVRFEVTGTVSEMKELRQFLDDNNINFKAI